MTQAIISKIFWFTKFDLANEFLFLYALILAQLVFALYVCVPIEADVCYDRVEAGDSASKKTEYKTIYFKRNSVDHGAVLQILAETARLEGVIFQDSKCTHQAVKQIITQLQSTPHTPEERKRKELTILKKIQAKIARLAVRFFLVAVLQNALQVNVQISMMAVSRVVTGSTDQQLLFSVVLGLLGLAMDFPDMVEAGKLMWRLMKQVNRLKELDSPSGDNPVSRDSQASLEERQERENLESECEKQLWECKCIYYRYCFYMVVYFGLLSYTLMKLFGFFWCKSHLVNGDGCAEFQTMPSTNNESHILLGAFDP